MKDWDKPRDFAYTASLRVRADAGAALHRWGKHTPDAANPGWDLITIRYSDQDWYALGQLGQFVTQLYPDFDSRSYGSAKLSDLLRKIPRFEVQQGPNGNLQVRDKA